MTREEIERILLYCQRAAEGPWTRSITKPKLVMSGPGKPGEKQKNVCHLNSGSHNEDWHNLHFLTKAHSDLPNLARHCLDLVEQLKDKNNEVEDKRGKNQWLRLKKANKQKQLERGRHRWLRLSEENEQLKAQATNMQALLDQATKLLEQEKENFRLELENTQQQLEAERENSKQELEKANNKLRLLGTPLTPENVGYSESLLNRLNNIESTFKNSGQLWQMDFSGPVAHAAKKDAHQSKAPGNDGEKSGMKKGEWMGELKKLESDFKSISKRMKDQDAAKAAAAANEFSEPVKKRSRAKSAK